MNFLLYMLGRARGHRQAIRPTGRQSLMAHAARAAGAGDLAGALGAYRTLADSDAGVPLDVLIRGHLHLVKGEMMEAAIHFAEGITRLHQTRAADGESPTVLERMLNESDRLLSAGSYANATSVIRRARALLEVILAGEAGLLLARPQLKGGSALESLSHLSDLTLRLLARTQVAERLAEALRERQLAAALAPWATSAGSVQEMLQTEANRLELLAKEMPGHAENGYRLGLLARAAGNGAQAAAAFRGVLALHPYHVSSAMRLAAVAGERGVEELRKAFFVPAETLGLFARFGEAACERLMDGAEQIGGPQDGLQMVARGNLAFALSEMALLDETGENWRAQAHV